MSASRGASGRAGRRDNIVPVNFGAEQPSSSRGDDLSLVEALRLPRLEENDLKHISEERSLQEPSGPAEAVGAESPPTDEELASAAGIVIRARDPKSEPAHVPDTHPEIDIPASVEKLRRAFDRVSTQVVGRAYR